MTHSNLLQIGSKRKIKEGGESQIYQKLKKVKQRKGLRAKLLTKVFFEQLGGGNRVTTYISWSIPIGTYIIGIKEGIFQQFKAKNQHNMKYSKMELVR